MWRTLAVRTPLARVLPEPAFAEAHSRRIAADPWTVWHSLLTICAADLPVTRLLMRVRGLSGAAAARPLVTDGPVPLQILDPPTYAAGVRVARPWKKAPVDGPPIDFHQAPAFTSANWLVMGTDYAIRTLSDDRTELRTETRCRPTSFGARVRFTPYWLGIRIFSGLIRREVLRAVALKAEAQSSTSRPSSVASSGAISDS